MARGHSLASATDILNRHADDAGRPIPRLRRFDNYGWLERLLLQKRPNKTIRKSQFHKTL